MSARFEKRLDAVRAAAMLREEDAILDRHGFARVPLRPTLGLAKTLADHADLASRLLGRSVEATPADLARAAVDLEVRAQAVDRGSLEEQLTALDGICSELAEWRAERTEAGSRLARP